MGALSRLLTLALLALAALALAGCGDDDSEDGDLETATLLVNSTADTAAADGELTLREAILLATGAMATADLDETELGQIDGTPGRETADTIQFDASLGEGPTIELAEALPALDAGNDTIDGRRAGGGEAPRPVLDGSAGVFRCIEITSSNNAILGIELTNCRTALLINQSAEMNRIGGPGAGEGNVISGNVVGVELRGRENVLQGNFIGTDRSGTEPLPNEFEGIWITPVARKNMIGGPNEGEGNVISGNPLFGISIDAAIGNVVQGNIIGLDVSATKAIENRFGVNIQAGATDNVIGGSEAGEGNTIAANETGVLIRGATTTDNTVRGNLFRVADIVNSVDVFEEADVSGNVIEDNEPPE